VSSRNRASGSVLGLVDAVPRLQAVAMSNPVHMGQRSIQVASSRVVYESELIIGTGVS
jgi:hypothetical protein